MPHTFHSYTATSNFKEPELKTVAKSSNNTDKFTLTGLYEIETDLYQRELFSEVSQFFR